MIRPRMPLDSVTQSGLLETGRRCAAPDPAVVQLRPCDVGCRRHCALSRRALQALLVSIGLAACRSEAPPAPDAATVEWRTYHGRELDVRLEYPSVFDVDESGAEVVFRSSGAPAMRVVWVTADEAERRGLWPGHAGTPVAVAGRRGMAYDYDHRDLDRVVRTISYVVPYRGRLLGLEFRTDAPALPDVYRRVLASLVLDESEAP